MASASAAPALQVERLNKTYPDGTRALHEFSLEVPRGQLLAVIGPSGAGKSTFMRCVNRLVEPTSGRIRVNGVDVTAAGKRQLRQVRREIGMVFQHFNLVDRLPTIRNVLHGRLGYTGSLAGAFGRFPQEDVERALATLDQVGLLDQAFKRCADLSGGQMQRVGIARAIMQGASLILADEPIASLDLSASETVMKHLKEVAVTHEITTVVNLHQVEFAMDFADRIVGIRDGELFCDAESTEIDESTIKELYFGEVPQLSDDRS